MHLLSHLLTAHGEAFIHTQWVNFKEQSPAFAFRKAKITEHHTADEKRVLLLENKTFF